MVKIMKNPIKMDDLGVPLFLETPISEGEKQLQLSYQLSSSHSQVLEEPPITTLMIDDEVG